MIRVRRLLILLVFLGASCSSNYEMMVKSYHDPETDFGKFRTFAVLPMTKGNPSLQRELLFQVKITMVNRGYKYNPVKPDFLIAMDLLTADYTPPGAIKIKTLPSVDETGKPFGPEPLIIRSAGPKPDAESGSDNAAFRTIVLSIADNRRPAGGAAAVVWEGVAQTPPAADRTDDVTRRAVEELLRDFPGGRPGGERRIPLERMNR